MIELRNLQKIYNKGKPNEINVINDTSLRFEDTGLVSITGPSGCGKTTLLNIIGGLDRFDEGEVHFDGEVFKRYQPQRWDIIRNKYVGYIFQNYNLVSDKTVYENIEITLHMAGLYDKDEINRRITYVLQSVGLYKYRRRNVKALSGGQQQRVAIARALAKRPKVILADEPTGNLDANNTYEVMRLIKKISQTCLVILVSHEKELVSFYSDRIIEVLDGRVVNDVVNQGKKTLTHLDDRNIYLKDLQKETQEGLVKVNTYYDELPEVLPEADIIYHNQTIFVKMHAANRVQYLTDDVDVHLIDDHYKKQTTSDMDQHQFDMTSFNYISKQSKRKSFIRFRDTIRDGFKQVLMGGKAYGKVFMLIFFIIAMIVVHSLATYANLTRLSEAEFVTMPKNAVGLTIDRGMDYDAVLSIPNQPTNPFISLHTQNLTMQFVFQDLYQASGGIRGARARVSAFPVPNSYLTEHEMMVGRLAEAKDEIAIDKWIADGILREKQVADLDIKSYSDVLKGELFTTREYGNLKIVGIFISNSPVVALSDENAYYFSQDEIGVMGSIRKVPTMVEGEYHLNSGEILVNETTGYKVGDTLTYHRTPLRVVGIYKDVNHVYILNNETFHDTGIKSLLGSQQTFSLHILSHNTQETIKEIESLGFYPKDLYQQARLNYAIDQSLSVAGYIRNLMLIMSGILVYIVLMMRSSMLGRIREIGIYRSIGATKRDIYKIFISEIIAFTTIGGMSGYLLMTYLVHKVQSTLGDLYSVYYFPIYLFVGGIVTIYIIITLFGMIPIGMLLRKTPSEIMAKYDI